MSDRAVLSRQLEENRDFFPVSRTIGVDEASSWDWIDGQTVRVIKGNFVEIWRIHLNWQPELLSREPRDAGLEEGFEVPAEGIVADGYTTADGKVVPDEMIARGLVAPGERRLIVPVAPLQAGLRLHAQRGLLDEELLARLRSLGVRVDEFMLSDIPEVDPRENNVFVAAVQHDSDLEKRMRGYGAVLVNLYGSAQGARPHTPVALATLIRAARQFDGLLRLEGVTVDEYSGFASLDLAA